MKRISITLIIATVLICAGIYSCQKEGGKDQVDIDVKERSILNQESLAQGKYFSWQPPGSKMKETKNGYVVTAPEGWKYIGYDQTKNLIFSAVQPNKTISCTCNNSSGKCKPFNASGPGGSISGCGGECTNCTMTQSMIIEHTPINIYSGGYYNPSEKTRILKNGESAPAVFDALFELPEFKTALKRFYEEAYVGYPVQNPTKGVDGSITAPKGYSLIGITIMGRGMAVIVPDKYAAQTLGFATTAKASCGCSNGTCALKDWQVLGTGAVWCDGECTTCTLTTDSRSQYSLYSISLPSYHF